MRLTLSLLRAPEDSPAVAAFSFRDGSVVIGRDPSCAWVIPDPKEEVSRRHAMIEFRGSGYWLEDLKSTNGVYLEAKGIRIGAPHPYRLESGDVLRFVDYIFRVEIDAEVARGALPPRRAREPRRDPPLGPLDQRYPSREPAPRPVARVERMPEPISLPDDNLAVSPVSDPIDAEKPAAVIDPDWMKNSSVFPRRVGESASVQPSVERSPDTRPPSSLPDNGFASADASASRTSDDSFAKFLAAAGLSGLSVDGAAAEQLGKVLRVAIAGLMDLLRARSEVKQQFRMEQSVFQATGNNPLKFAATPDQVLDQLFVHRDHRNLPAVEAVASGIEDLKWHQIALMAGMRQAILGVLHSFDPQVLKPQLEEQGSSGGFGWNSGPRLWEQYESMYEGIRNDLDRYFKREIGDAFVEEYERQVRELERRHGARSTAGRR